MHVMQHEILQGIHALFAEDLCGLTIIVVLQRNPGQRLTAAAAVVVAVAAIVPT